MAFGQINGIKLYYEKEGEEGPLVVFVSGFSTHRETWRAFAKELLPNCQTLIFDNRGAGESDAPSPPYTIDQMADDVAHLMGTLKLPPAYFVGSSMGTAILLTLALRHPKIIKEGLLLAPFAQLPRTSLLKSESIAKLLEANVPMPIVIESVLPWLYSNAFLSDLVRSQAKCKEMEQNPFPQKPEGYLGQLAALQTYDIRHELAQIKTPFHLMAGKEDVSSPLACAEEIHHLLPSSTLLAVDEVAHMIHAEKPDLVLEQIKQMVIPS